jgi:hypothetical protein
VYQTDNVPGLYVYNGSIWALQGDNLGNHTATQNLNLSTNQLVGNGGSQGLSITNTGGLLGSSTITASQDLIADASQANTGTLSGGLRLGGSSSGEGLASKRSGGGNQFGLDFYTSSLNRLSITGGGNVGIGTSAPGQLLEIGGQATPTLLLHSNGNSLVSGSTMQFRENDLSYGWNLRHNSGSSEGGTTNDRLLLERLYGNGPVNVMSWDQTNGNVGIGTANPRGKLDVTGGDTYLVADPDNGTSQTAYLPGHLFLAPYSGSSGTAFVQARVPNPTASTNIGLTLRTTNAGTLVDAVNITPTGDLNVSGNVGLNYYQYFIDSTLPGHSRGYFPCACPAGYRLLSGGGGHRDYNSAQIDITVNYSGPDNSDPTHVWTVLANNDSGSSRTIRVWCTCAKVQ